jgi:hypothetical protein
MLRACSLTSFYLNDELVDTEYLTWSNRQPNGSRNHKKMQALTNLRLLAYTLANGQDYGEENIVKQWIKEVQ